MASKTKTPADTTALAEFDASPLELLTIRPEDLLVRDQAREDATPDEELIASVRQHGIIQPPVVKAAGDRYVIVTGHRRVGAAIAAGLPQITCVLRTTPLDGDPLDADALTLEEQLVENERRKQLTAKDLVAGFQKLTLFGLRPEDIAASLGEKPDRVRAGLKVTGSERVTALIDEEPSIDFAQAATIAEFDSHPKLQAKLIETATNRPQNFHRDVETFRKERLVEDRVAELKAQLKSEGVKVVDVMPYEASWWTGNRNGGGEARTLDRLGIRPEDHTDCPGHAAIIHRAQVYYLDSENGIDTLYVCTDWKANGHEIPGTAPRERTPEEIADDEEWERRKQEHAKQRQLINANTRTRRTWIREHLTGGRLRPTAQHFELVADAIATLVAVEEGIPAGLALELLTGTECEPWNAASEGEFVHVITSRTTQPLRTIIATALAVFEDHVEGPDAAKYLPALEALGYTLTDTDREHLTAARDALAEDAIAVDEDGADDEDGEGDDTEEDA
nr:ParB N-terminal domain-containing protein [Microbacterium bovistercoris]